MDQIHTVLILDIPNRGGKKLDQTNLARLCYFYWLLVIIVCIMTIRLSFIGYWKFNLIQSSEEKMGRSV